jgi:predicted nuclease of predicted toxin-antitoxin system
MLRFLADVNVERAIVDLLIQKGYDVKWIPDYDCEIEDEKLIELMNSEDRILITNDKDFGELTFLQKTASRGIILIRVPGQNVAEKVQLISKLITEHGDRVPNHFVVVTKAKMRFIPLEEVG